ncbi:MULTISPECIES: hypothetical protein [Aquimarina]|uniref:Uncharacterized protein n=1 Tax=Aquimarina algiphila TaxID=2047982 RepID=A0A554VL36_9FLAO|nr:MULTISPECIES: hypothetical protein [Aquimarina]TSE08817.1 hypothetical protein FOF46_10965 [Aquimarina algiphila]
MKSATVKEIKTELNECSHQDLIELCLRLSRFKKENKELLTYLLFESGNEDQYIENVKNEVDEQFTIINITSYYFIKKSVRKILRTIKKYIRYSKNKETEIELLLYFCKKLKDFEPSITSNSVLMNIHNREIASIKKKITLLHEDLQYDYKLELQNLYF